MLQTPGGNDLSNGSEALTFPKTQIPVTDTRLRSSQKGSEMDKKRKKVRPAKVIGVAIVLTAIFVAVGARQLHVEGVFSRPQVLAEAQSVESEAPAVSDPASQQHDPVEHFTRILAQDTGSSQRSLSSLESIAGTQNVRLVLMVLITLSISMLCLFLAILANSRASKAAAAASQAITASLAEDQKRRICEAADKANAFGSQLRDFEKKTAAILAQLSGLETSLEDAGQNIRGNAAALSEIREDLAQFKQFKSSVEQIHHSLADAFSLTQDTQSTDQPLPEQEDIEESEEDEADSGEDTRSNWTDRYGYPMAG